MTTSPPQASTPPETAQASNPPETHVAPNARPAFGTPADFARWFDESWREETYSPPWSKALEGLTAEHAAWKPAGAKHSIWMIVNHMAFWREFKLRELAGEPRDEAEVARRNWAEPAEITDAAWRADVTTFTDLHAQIRDAMAASERNAALLRNFIEHASYHFGQIMLIRAMLGLKPLDSFG